MESNGVSNISCKNLEEPVKFENYSKFVEISTSDSGESFLNHKRKSAFQIKINKSKIKQNSKKVCFEVLKKNQCNILYDAKRDYCVEYIRIFQENEQILCKIRNYSDEIEALKADCDQLKLKGVNTKSIN